MFTASFKSFLSSTKMSKPVEAFERNQSFNQNPQLMRFNFGKNSLCAFPNELYCFTQNIWKGMSKPSDIQKAIFDNLWFSFTSRNEKACSNVCRCLEYMFEDYNNYVLTKSYTCYVVTKGAKLGIFADWVEVQPAILMDQSCR